MTGLAMPVPAAGNTRLDRSSSGASSESTTMRVTTCVLPPIIRAALMRKRMAPHGQGLTLVHVIAQLEHIRDTCMGQVGLRGAQRQLKLS